MTEALDRYLELERLLLTLPDESDEAERLREAMDPLWYRLNARERAYLDDRRIVPYRALVGAVLPGGPGLFCPIPERPEEHRRSEPITGLRGAA